MLPVCRSFPPSWSQLASLTLLYCPANYLSGTLPAEYGGLANLTYFNISQNNITGVVGVMCAQPPQQFCADSTLQSMWWRHNGGHPCRVIASEPCQYLQPAVCGHQLQQTDRYVHLSWRSLLGADPPCNAVIDSFANGMVPTCEACQLVQEPCPPAMLIWMDFRSWISLTMPSPGEFSANTRSYDYIDAKTACQAP